MTFKIGDRVKMVNCFEARKNPDKIWIVRSDPWILESGEEVVKLEGKSRSISCYYLQSATIRDVQKLASSYKEDFNIGPHSIWFHSSETSIGFNEDIISVIDCEGNQGEVSLNEIIAYVLMTGTPAEGE